MTDEQGRAKSDNAILRELVTLTRGFSGTVSDKLKQIGEELDDVRDEVNAVKNILNGDGVPGYIARTYALEKTVEKLERVAESTHSWRYGIMGSLLVLLVGVLANLALHFAK